MRWIVYVPALDSFESSEVAGTENKDGGHGRRILYSGILGGFI
jgi:hypothetical protein